jgi:gamma-glutamyltranspeptidase/glutathione hydrolase
MEPVSCGVGGDLFAIVWDPKTKHLYGYNGSGRSPKGLTLQDMKRKVAGRPAIPPFGSLSVTVPGAVDGWYALHDKFGKLPMSDLLAPAISYARDGFPLSQYIAALWAANMEGLAFSQDVEEFENAQHTYLINGTAPVQGQVFKNPDLRAHVPGLGARRTRRILQRPACQDDGRIFPPHRRRSALRRFRGPSR